jgi:hypothetical protein
VFIDMSNSLGEEAFERELQSLQSVFLGLSEKGSKVRAYPLHGDTGRGTRPLIDEYLAPNEYSGDRKKTEEYRNERHTKWEEYERTIGNDRQKLQADSRRDGALAYTCILHSFFYVSEFFNTQRSVKKKRLIFISDMLEDCLRTGIDMDKSLERFKNAQSQAERFLETGSYSKDCLRDVEITIIFPGSTGASTLPAWIDDPVLLNFWSRVFSQLGADASKISFEIK